MSLLALSLRPVVSAPRRFCAPSFLRPVVSAPRRFCAPSFLRPVVSAPLLVTLSLVSLALTASADAAGSYSAPSFSGGYWTFDDDPNSYPFPQANPYAGDHEDANFCGGDLTATSTWTPDNTADTSPAPQVIVTQVADAYWDVRGVNGYPTASCADGLGDSEVDTTYMAGYYSGDSGRTNYSVQSPSGNTVTVTCSGVKATMDLNSTTPPVDDGDVGASWGVTLSPVIVSLTGTLTDNNGNPILDSNGNQQILVGQGCGASLSGIPTALLPYTTYSWSVSDSANTFLDWQPTTPAFPNASPPTQADPNASYYDPGPGVQTNPTYHWYWNDPTQTTETVTCTATVTPPAGQGSAFSVTATQNVMVYVPTVGVHTNSVGLGYVASAQSGNQTVTGMVAAPTQAMRNKLLGYGSSWTTSVSLPTAPAFGAGQWGYAQLITPGEYLTGGNGVQTPSTDTTRGDGLDASFPYVVSSTDSGLQPTDGNPYNDGDSPSLAGLNVSVASAKLLDYFRTYLMFKPPGSDVRWVPLAESLWATNFNASIPASGSWLDFPASQSVGPVTLTNDFMLKNEFPKWSQIVLSNQPFIHN